VFELCLQVTQTIIEVLPHTYQKLLLRECQEDLMTQEAINFETDPEYLDKITQLNQKHMDATSKIDSSLDAMRRLMIHWKQKAITKEKEYALEIAQASSSLAKLKQQVRDMDSEGVILTGCQKPDFIKRMQ